MTVFLNDNFMDESLNRLKNNGVRLVLCNNAPVTFNEAQTNKGTTVAGGGTARRLGQATIASSDYTGPANGDTSGRKLTVNQVTGLSIDITSTGANHVAIVSSTTASELHLVAPIATPQDVTSGNTATINAFDWEIRDATT